MEKKENASKLISSLVALSLATTLGVPTIALADATGSDEGSMTAGAQQQQAAEGESSAVPSEADETPAATQNEAAKPLPNASTDGVTTITENGTYSISSDTKTSIVVNEGVTATIDIDSGVKLANTAGKHTITNNGTLTITGEGTVDNTSHGRGAVVNKPGATATLSGCTYRRSLENGSTDSNNGGNSWYTIKNYGDMVISGKSVITTGSNNSSLESIGKYSSLVANGWQNTDDLKSNPKVNGKENATMKIEGCDFSGGLNTVKNDDYGNLTIAGGTFKNYTQAALQNHGVATISNGTFDADSNFAVFNCPCDKTADLGELTISGGEFKGNIFTKTPGYGFIKVTGGTFTDPNVYQYAQSGTVDVKLAKDYSGNVTIPAGVTSTLDLNGHTATVPDCGITTYGSFTLINSQSTGGKLASEGTPVMAVGPNGKFILSSGIVESTKDYGVYAKEGGSAVINGGSVSSNLAALSGNNTTGDMNFTVNGGTLTAKSGPAIYMPGQVNLSITGGVLNGGISLRMGQVNISGGIINAMTDESAIDRPDGKVNGEPSYTYSGNVWFPDALYVIGGTYPSGNSSFGNSLNLTITGGTFNCENSLGSAVAIYDLGKVEQSMKASVSGSAKLSTKANGRDAFQVLSFKDFGVSEPASGYNNANYVGKVNSSVTGGTFSSDPTAYIADGYEAVKSGDNWVVQVPYTPAPAPTTETTTTTNPDGTTTTTVTDKKTGESTSTTEGANGTTVVKRTDASGNTMTEVTVPEGAATNAGAPVEIPAAAEVAKGEQVSVSAPAGTVVALPVASAGTGDVAVIVHADGTETVIPMSLVEGGKAIVKLDGNETVKIVDNAKDFSDVPAEHWAAGDIDFASSHEIFKGIGNGDTYEPETALTRNMMMTVLARTAGADTEGGDPWYAKGQQWAVENGVSNGLRGEDSITREQLVTMLFNYANKAGLDTSARADISGMENAGAVSDWATEAVQWAVAEGILKGVDNTDLAPQGLATRAQAAAFMQRYVKAALL